MTGNGCVGLGAAYRHRRLSGMGTEQIGLAPAVACGSSMACWKPSWPARYSATGWPAAACTCRSPSLEQRK